MKACAPTRANWTTAEPPPKIDEIADRDVAGEHHIVGEDAVIADAAIMADMGIGEKSATVADHRLQPAAGRAGIHRHAFADQAVGADGQGRVLAAIFEVLRLMADRGERENARARADRGAAGDDDMRDSADALAEHDLAADMAERPDPDACAEPGAVLDDRGGVNRRVRRWASRTCHVLVCRRHDHGADFGLGRRARHRPCASP